jgi:hypothetical protein
MNDVAPILAVTTQTHVMASEVSNRRAKTRHNFQLPGTVPPERPISSYYLAELPGTGAVSQPNSAGASAMGRPAKAVLIAGASFLRCSLITNHPNGRRVSVHWFAGVLQSLCSLS